MHKIIITLDENDMPKKWYNILPDMPTPVSPPLHPGTKEPIGPKDPNSPGSLGIEISEAVEDATTHENTHYSLGSVLNHVMLHQTVIGQEAKEQLASVEDYPDIIIGSVGGGSNFAGISFPFLMDKLSGKKDMEVIGVEPTACPSLTGGEFRYDFGDAVGLTPLLKMFTMGHDFVPAAIHAGGLRYHGDSPIVSQLYADKIINAVAYDQTEVFKAGVTFARCEGIVPAPESSHAIKCAIDKALECKKNGEQKTILFNLSGHGHFDMSSYDSYFSGEMKDIV